MKKLIICLVSMLLATGLYAQSNYIETVYLKNGGIIRGIIIEQIPGDNIKIRTKDGNVFVYNYEEISKITKDIRSLTSRDNNYSGYKGFIDFGYSIPVGDESASSGRLDFTTSHGYQVNSFFYAGLGAGVNYYCQDGIDSWSFPLFFNPRLTIPTSSIVSPFLDVKIGYTVGEDIKGFYLSPSIGTRFLLTNNNAINFSIGYTLQNVKYEYGYGYYYESGNLSLNAITLKLGFEF
ncbi:MAG: hypothetical protein QM653_09100 [Dysgonomonas sp.]|uniref:hypothetical protein n=1 Tax=Dysgonomonas sp. TaxID=1891233 RepID=UPI0039E58D24